MIKRTLRKIFHLLEFIATAGGVAIFLYLLIVQPHQVQGQSMDPTLIDKSYLLTDKLSYRFGDIQRGDIVVFEAPEGAYCPIKDGCDFIKRIIAVPGDRIKVQNQKIWLNGEPLDESYLPPSRVTRSGKYLTEGHEIIIPADQYITIGDNRPNSSDSRDWGPVDSNKIVGKAFLKYWPTSIFGFIKH